MRVGGVLGAVSRVGEAVCGRKERNAKLVESCLWSDKGTCCSDLSAGFKHNTLRLEQSSHPPRAQPCRTITHRHTYIFTRDGPPSNAPTSTSTRRG